MDFKKTKEDLLSRLIKFPSNLAERRGNEEIQKKLLALYVARCKEKATCKK